MPCLQGLSSKEQHIYHVARSRLKLTQECALEEWLLGASLQSPLAAQSSCSDGGGLVVDEVFCPRASA